MSHSFQKITEVESLPEVPENATVLCEVDGTVKRVPGDSLGGAPGVTTLHIFMDEDVPHVNKPNCKIKWDTLKGLVNNFDGHNVILCLHNSAMSEDDEELDYESIGNIEYFRYASTFDGSFLSPEVVMVFSYLSQDKTKMFRCRADFMRTSYVEEYFDENLGEFVEHNVEYMALNNITTPKEIFTF